MKRKIGFFGGSFDPIHFGHLNLLTRLKEIAKLDFIWICPVFCSVFKVGAPPHISGAHRLAMIEQAIEGIEGVGALDLELKLEKPCYTIDTIRTLMNQERGEYYLLLGEDTMPHFHLWHSAQELIQLAKPLIGKRNHELPRDLKEMPQTIAQALREGLHAIPSMDVSSTEIRTRLKNRLYCGHLVPDKVLDYIYQNDLYYASKSTS